MKKSLLLLAVALASTFLSGCSYGTLSKNLAEDGAIVRADVNSPWGKQTIVRIGTTTNSVRISTDGEIVINERPVAAASTAKPSTKK